MIYADNAATTEISELAFNKMLPFLHAQFGNASSQYSLGVNAKRAIDQAHWQIASAVNAEPNEIIFTSSGTESNNWVLRSVVAAYSGERVHIITSSIEHPSVINTCHMLESIGADVTFLPVDKYGQVDIDAVKSAITPNTKLVSIMFANNEVGTIQPIAELGILFKELGIMFHSDAVQAVGHIPVDISKLNVDFLTASAHKFYGAKGTGILFKRLSANISPLIYGGGQENGLRSGTENVAGIVAAGYALEECIEKMDEETGRLRIMVRDTVDRIRNRLPNVRVNGNTEKCLPGLVNLGFECVSGESLMHILDLRGICVSTSSACHSGKDDPSHVLLAMGQTEQQAKSAIRISYGRFSIDEDVVTIADAICDAYEKVIARA